MAVAAVWAGNVCLGCDDATNGSNYCSEQCRIQTQHLEKFTPPESHASTPTITSRYPLDAAGVAASSQGKHDPSSRPHGLLDLTTSYGGSQQVSSTNQSSTVSSQSNIIPSAPENKTSQSTAKDYDTSQYSRAGSHNRHTRHSGYLARVSRTSEPHGGYNRTSGISPYDRTSTIAWCTAWRPHNSSLIEATDAF